ncbi:hypothetical protein BKA65DRAFT_61319 [Rhexocercosporidium sp. MPI-PUGE-AT-0058]|nr:hypothetical protein BKA65DRAFT_61319 [Rhexocercosporidium sp. MPI-PUGE-AT-0058]
MHSLVKLSMIAGASASPLITRSSCWFGLTASGGQSGTLGQLPDGQIRIGGGLAPASFSIDEGKVTDDSGFGCLLTEGIEQLQCDQGKSPIPGFSIGSNGSFSYSKDTKFYACPASDSEWNVYTTPVEGQKKCVEITLTASGCGVAPPSSVAPSVIVSTVTVHDCATTQPGGPISYPTVQTHPPSPPATYPPGETYPPSPPATYPPGPPGETHPPSPPATYPPGPPAETYPPAPPATHPPGETYPPSPPVTYPPGPPGETYPPHPPPTSYPWTK